MRKRGWLAAGGSVLAATIGLLGGGTAASASTASPVVGYTYIEGTQEHGEQLRAPRTESTGPANCPERCGGGHSRPPRPSRWPGKLDPGLFNEQGHPTRPACLPETIRAAQCQLSTATATVRSRSDDHQSRPDIPRLAS